MSAADLADVASLVEHLGDLDDAALAEFVAHLSPQDLRALEILLPPDPAALERARTDTADGFGWLRRIAPEMYPLEPGYHHRYLVDLLPPDGPEGRRAVLAAFRGAGKSTTASVGLPLLALTRRSHRFVVVIRETLPESVSVVDGIRKFLEERADLLERYPWLRPLPGEKGELRTAGGAIVLARSAHGAIRGLQRSIAGRIIRPDLVIGDDVYDDEAARSAMQTERLEEWLLGTVGGLAGPAGDAGVSPLDVILIGTTIERGDLVSRMLEGRGPFASWRRTRFPAEARVVETAQAREVPGDHADDPHVAVDVDGVYVPVPVDGAAVGDRVAAWPAGSPLHYLDRLQDPASESFVGSRVYAREYLLRPRQPGDSLFERDRTVWVENLTGRVLEAKIRIERTAEGVDPSTGDSDDYSALVVTGLVRLGDVLDLDGDVANRPGIAVLHAERERLSLHGLLERCEDIAETYTALGIHVVFEAQGGFAWGAQELRRRRKAAVRAVAVDRSKHARALPLSVWHEAGRFVADATLRGSSWDDEFHAFTGTDADVHDDLVDATVHAATYSSNAWRR